VGHLQKKQAAALFFGHFVTALTGREKSPDPFTVSFRTWKEENSDASKTLIDKLIYEVFETDWGIALAILLLSCQCRFLPKAQTIFKKR